MSLQQSLYNATTVRDVMVASIPPGRRTRAENWLEDRIRKAERAPFAEIGKLTPDLAKILLARNPENRPMISGAKDKYSRIVTRGDWKLNGESIIISKDGLLNDGQHRCQAVIDSDVPIDTVFAFGIERNTRNTTDNGQKRVLKGAFTMDGIPNAIAMSAAVCLLYNYDHGRASVRDSVDTIEATRYYEANIGLQGGVYHGHKCYRFLGGSLAAFTCAWYIFVRVSSITEANRYFASLSEGLEMNGPRDPVNVFRRYLMDAQKSNKKRRIEERLADMINAWNARRTHDRFRSWERGTPFPVAV